MKHSKHAGKDDKDLSADATEPVELTDPVDDPGSQESVPRAEFERISAQLAEKEKELAEFKDKYLRALADSDNARKRMRQQSEETVRIQRENMLRELLPIVDNLERAVAAARGGGNGKPIVEGVEMVLRSMLDFLRGHGVTQLSVVGETFDPQRHEAIAQVESSQHPPNTVLEEHHRGYLIGDRMLRPARVSVAKSGNGGNGDKNGKAGDTDVENN
jgi:molecular chaperone GrpE